ncbi:MAG: TVP38/TMEM64 family protein [Candidatus Babeliales bacterium]
MKYLNLEWVQTHQGYLLALVRDHYWYTVFCYIALYILAVALALPGAFIITMLGGYLFNVFPGVIYINIGATLGATIAFIAARYLVGMWVQRTYQVQLRAINQAIKENGFYYLLFARLAAIFPFFLVNLLAGLTRVKLSTFIWTTSLGIIPGSLVFAYAGKQLMYIRSASDILSFPIILAFFLLSLLVLIPVLIKKLW